MIAVDATERTTWSLVSDVTRSTRTLQCVRTPDVIVVGAGVIGLSSAVAIAQDGRAVCVVDPAPGSGASRAAAGMLSPGAEWSVEDPSLGESMVAARAMWPQFAERISVGPDAPVTVHDVGSLFLAWDHSDAREWQRHLDVIAEQGIITHSVDRSGSSDLFGRISPRVASGAYVPDDAYVDPDKVLTALEQVALSLGVSVVRSPAIQCRWDEGSVWVDAGGVEIRAGCGIVATGAFPVAVEGVSAQNHVRPIRGVTLRLAGGAPGTGWMVRAIVAGRHVYVIARTDGSIIVGSTSDESSETVVEARHIRQLLDDAVRIIPGIDDARFVEARVGLRPAPDSHRSFFEVLGESRWAWSSGHFRHGYLLAPLAADRAKQFVAASVT